MLSVGQRESKKPSQMYVDEAEEEEATIKICTPLQEWPLDAEVVERM